MYPNVELVTLRFELEKELENIKGSEKCFILTEDSKSFELIKVIFESNNFNFSETSIKTYESCSQIGSVKLFSAFIRDRFPQIRIIVHRDRDYLTDTEVNKLKKQFENINVNLFITDGTDIESHFINKFHINKCHPEISIKEADTLIKESLNENKEKSIDLIKTKEFGNRHKDKSSHLDLAIENLYSSNKLRFTHGKTLYKSLKNKIQHKIKENAKINIKSDFLKIKYLEEISNEIWK